MKIISSILSFILCISLQGQVNWANDVAPIFYSKCLSCHNSNGISGSVVNLEFYQPAFQNSVLINQVVSTGQMPPWPADTNYSTLTGQHKRTLTSSERNTIQQWVVNGGLSGDTLQKPPVPIFPVDGDIAATPDDVLHIPLFNIDTTGLEGNDVYRCFVLPSGLTSDKFITAIDYVPGNRNGVHHMALFYDTTGQAKQLDAQDSLPGYSSYGGAGFMPVSPVGGWAPGIESEFYPNGMGVLVHKNGDYILQIHYPSSVHGQQDSTYLKIYYTSNPSTRRIILAAPLSHSSTMTNGPLVVPVDSIKTFYEEYTTPVVPFSLIGVVPHMHNVGVKIKSFAVSPQNDTIPFVSINKWDFNHQMQYKFQKPIKIEPNTVLHAEATFDNTLNNPKSPRPLRTIYAGESSDEEMMMVAFGTLLYQIGDENLILDSTLLLSTKPEEIHNTGLEYYPNPSSGILSIRILDYNDQNEYRITLINASGEKVYNEKLVSKKSKLHCEFLSSGLYFIQFTENDKSTAHGKLVIQN